MKYKIRAIKIMRQVYVDEPRELGIVSLKIMWQMLT